MNVEEVYSIVVDTAFHPHRERRSSLRHYLDDRTLEELINNQLTPASYQLTPSEGTKTAASRLFQSEIGTEAFRLSVFKADETAR